MRIAFLVFACVIISINSFTQQLNVIDTIRATYALNFLDMNVSFRFSKNIKARINLNNITDKQYFTKRPTFYPGPGVWPSDGRNFSASVIIHL